MPFVSIVHNQNKILHSFIFSIHVHCGGQGGGCKGCSDVVLLDL